MNPRTLMFDRHTKRRLFSVPCVDLEIARTVAIANELTVNVVQNGQDEFVAVYEGGKLIGNGHAQIAAWMNVKGFSVNNGHSVTAGAPRPEPRGI